MFTKEAIAVMKEDELRERVLMPLMRAMGYQDVFEWHGPNELGKDIVGSRESPLGGRENTVVVAKARDITAGTNSVSDVVTQISQAFNSGFDDPSSARHQPVHWCWIVTNKRMSRDARDAIRRCFADLTASRLTMTDGDQLWEFVKQYLPVNLFNALAHVETELRDVIASPGVDVILGGSGLPVVSLESSTRRVIVTDRYLEGAGIDSLSFLAEFQFPDTDEGKEQFEVFKQHVSTGSKAVIYGEFVSISAPDIIKTLAEQVFGVELSAINQLEMWSRPDPRPVPIRIDFEADDGDKASLDYIELRMVQAGEDEITLTNAEQPIPILVSLRYDLVTRRHGLTVTTKPEPIPAPMLETLAQVGVCMMKAGTWRLSLVATGLPFSEGRNIPNEDQSFNEDLPAFACDMTTIQERLHIPILIPDGEFAPEDAKTAAILRTILHYGAVDGSWRSLAVPVNMAGAANVLRISRDLPMDAIVLETDAYEEMFGTTLPLGRVRYIYPAWILENEDEIRASLAASDGSDVTVVVQLKPGTHNRMRAIYLDWQPAS